jgi:hypothetical protein
MSYENGAAVEHGVTFQFSDLPDFRQPTHWTYLQLDAFHPSSPDPIGYLRVAFIHRDTGEAMNQERFLLLQVKGTRCYPLPKELDEVRVDFHDPSTWDNWKKKPDEAARYVLETALREPYTAWNDRLRELNDEAKVALVEQNRRFINQATQEALEREFAFGVNKADVDYISLEDGWQGKGLGQSMYRAMAHFLDVEYGMTLNSSTTQTIEATRVWDRMKAKGMVRADEKGRLFFVEGVSAATLESRDVVPSPVVQPQPKRGRRGPR